MTAIINLTGIGKAFDGGTVHALQDVSVSVKTGELVALVGTSGSGKTTLLKAINRLTDVEGQVEVDGVSVASLAPPELRRRIGYVFQGVGLFPHMTVAENIAITPRLLGWAKGDIAARVDELLDLVELPRAVASRLPEALSGGQRQRVGVARGLAARPKIMLMDEPFGALDPVTRDSLGRAYRGLHDSLGLTTVMVTHDVQEAVLMADRILVMAEGQLIADGTPSELMALKGDERVTGLMDMPRLQAERIAALVGGKR
jgi:osmoprotectant transport system ATP-binding protein